jgi:hypothetical protein
MEIRQLIKKLRWMQAWRSHEPDWLASRKERGLKSVEFSEDIQLLIAVSFQEKARGATEFGNHCKKIRQRLEFPVRREHHEIHACYRESVWQPVKAENSANISDVS